MLCNISSFEDYCLGLIDWKTHLGRKTKKIKSNFFLNLNNDNYWDIH